MGVRISAVAGLVAISAVLFAHAADTPVAKVKLQGLPTYSGGTGYAHLVFRPEGTDVLVLVPPVSGVTLPVHVYTYLHQGTCSVLGPLAAMATRHVLGYPEPSGYDSVRNTVPLSLNTVRAGPHAVAVRSGPADGNQLLYCGDLRMS